MIHGTDPIAAPYATATPGQESTRPRVTGKFLAAGDETLFVRGVTYGTFRPGADGGEYRPETVERDFSEMADNRINAVRTYTVPPRWLLDAAQQHGLRVMVGLPWEQHIAFLEGQQPRAIEDRVRAGVRACAGHPAVLCYAIGNEIPASIVRWYGHRRIERFLERLCRATKVEDPEGLVTYVNYPSTEYLDLPFLDFVAFNVYLESPDQLRAYLSRLHNLAGDRPLLLAEIGLDSRRHGEDAQARSLNWQIRSAFAAGCAGAFAFAWTDEWHRGGYDVDDWDFGLTDRDRRPKPALAAVRNAFAEVPFPQNAHWPRISVVVCSHNGAKTIQDCLKGIQRLDYPKFEAIVVDDGSTDRTAAIAAEYDVQLIQTENRGLSAARNTGLAAASGDIVAYIDDDARPAPYWLTYLASTFRGSNYDGVGGPNIAPPGDGEIAECVANSPGGPVHVLLTDEVAEHIPGCNMAFRVGPLRAIGGFDPRFRVAGDDVDVCWRLQEQGRMLGFSPAAVVWHHRRNSLRAYWRQQVGYGRAEALLEAKWPERYNAAGHLTWAGRLYGKGLTAPLPARRRLIYQGVWGSAPFQSLYEPASGLLASLPLMPEWWLVVLSLAGLSALGILWAPLLLALPLLALTIGAPVAQAAISAGQARFATAPRNRFSDLKRRGLTTLLHVLQPIARLRGRQLHGLTPWRRRGGRKLALPLPRSTTVWTESWREPSTWLEAVEADLQRSGAVTSRGGPYDRWDLVCRGGVLGASRLLMSIEEHGGGRQYVRFRWWPWCSAWAVAVPMVFLALALLAASDSPIVAVVLGLAAAALLLWLAIECALPIAAFKSAVNDLDEVNERRVATATVTAAKPPAGANGRAGINAADDWEGKNKGVKTNLRQVRHYVSPYRRLMVASVALIVMGSAASLLQPWPLAILVDNVIETHPLPDWLARVLGPIGQDRISLLIFAVLGGFVVTLLFSGLTVIENYVNTKLDQSMVLDLRSDLVQHAQRLSLAFHDKSRTGRLMFTINDSAKAVGGICITIPALLRSLITLVGMAWVAASINIEIAVLAMVVAPFLTYAIRFYTKRIEPRLREVRRMEGDSMTIVHETMAMQRVVVAFGREDHEFRRFRDQGERAVAARVKLTVRQTLFSLAVNTTTAAGNALVLGVGALYVLQGRLTVGDLLVVISYVASMYQPLEAISATAGTLQEKFVALGGALGLLETQPEIKEVPDAIAIDNARGDVRFEDIHFSYRGRKDTLRKISFEAKAGEAVCILGPTGAGKSTLISLLPRFYDPKSGRILLDGTDTRQLTLKSLREQISIVLQEPLLFAGTIAENIRYGRLDASDEAVIEAAKCANAHDFISRLPDGYESKIGERGSQLSGGERQRIAVARAFLKDAPILILDEPTSSIDSKTEAVILDALDRLMEGRTTFMIAHRLSTIRSADKILVLNQGELAEMGTHDELIERDGLYRQIYETQMDIRRSAPEPAAV